ncbi:gamma-glutamylcyclotransferase [Nitrogeniibacter mangrovi]|uniref:Putative gamma-glutamylcyclotransferase n=1 Tax=Nitrogeniibacter mangrovi TaxID=2016596 RepID=A0A6C1B0N7_9RHOO|nr:gamma-glutamylcyclotransferase family protein [Nitrogeniibacter mangrovi]QID17166.1 gamma-glutamylcyclotransferase [Nitrogeniibacter mangrovi]
MDHCFTYGSLMCEDIFTAVTGLVLRPEAAVLEGYARHPVIGTDYPGVRRRDGARVPGRLYRNVSPAGVAYLDRFEGDEYRRERLEVTLCDGHTVAAWVYVFDTAQGHRLDAGPWDFEHFLREGKARFLLRHPPAPL